MLPPVAIKNTPDMAQIRAKSCINEGRRLPAIHINNITTAGAMYSSTVAVAEFDAAIAIKYAC